MSEQEYQVNLRNFEGKILNTFTGTPDQILDEMEKTLDWDSNYIWSELVKEMLVKQKEMMRQCK